MVRTGRMLMHAIRACIRNSRFVFVLGEGSNEPVSARVRPRPPVSARCPPVSARVACLTGVVGSAPSPLCIHRLTCRAITGPVSSPDYLSHLARAPEFRGVAPTSFPVRASVPYAEPDRVYDTKYYTRDMRRSELNTRVARRTWTNEGAGGAVAARDASRTGGVYKWGEYKSILDVENDGFTS